MIISGYKWNVQWGDTNSKKCFELAKHAFYGVKDEPQINTSDDVACVLYQSLNSKENNFKDWPITIEPPTLLPFVFEDRPESIPEGGWI